MKNDLKRLFIHISESWQRDKDNFVACTIGMAVAGAVLGFFAYEAPLITLTVVGIAAFVVLFPILAVKLGKKFKAEKDFMTFVEKQFSEKK